MLYSCKEAVRLERDANKQQIKQFRSILSNTKGYGNLRLVLLKRGAKEYLTIVERTPDNRSGKYIRPATDHDVAMLQRQRFLQEAIKRMEHNRQVMDRLLRDYQDASPQAIRRDLPPSYRFADHDLFDVHGVPDVAGWIRRHEEHGVTITQDRGNAMREDRGRKGNRNHPENLIHQDAGGQKMRSKSEVILANIFRLRGIEFDYEPLRIIAGHEMHPDFVLRTAKLGGEIFWEHFGLMNEEQYRKTYAWKMGIYAEEGYLPGVNLVATFDDDRGGIDVAVIERWIRLLL